MYDKNHFGGGEPPPSSTSQRALTRRIRTLPVADYREDRPESPSGKIKILPAVGCWRQELIGGGAVLVVLFQDASERDLVAGLTASKALRREG
jgi:hypothetical protein